MNTGISGVIVNITHVKQYMGLLLTHTYLFILVHLSWLIITF